MIFMADQIFLPCSLNLVLRLNPWLFRWVDLAEEFRMWSLNVCPSLSKNGGETELFTGIFRLESPNSIVQDPSCRITDIEYWSAKSFPRISGVLMPLTTYASTLILTGPSGVWKYKSISTYPEMDAFPVTWTKLTHCPTRYHLPTLNAHPELKHDTYEGYGIVAEPTIVTISDNHKDDDVSNCRDPPPTWFHTQPLLLDSQLPYQPPNHDGYDPMSNHGSYTTPFECHECKGSPSTAQSQHHDWAACVWAFHLVRHRRELGRGDGEIHGIATTRWLCTDYILPTTCPAPTCWDLLPPPSPVYQPPQTPFSPPHAWYDPPQTHMPRHPPFHLQAHPPTQTRGNRTSYVTMTCSVCATTCIKCDRPPQYVPSAFQGTTETSKGSNYPIPVIMKAGGTHHPIRTP